MPGMYFNTFFGKLWGHGRTGKRDEILSPRNGNGARYTYFAQKVPIYCQTKSEKSIGLISNVSFNVLLLCPTALRAVIFVLYLDMVGIV